MNVSFYGGASGGGKKKSSILEVGFVLAIELKKNQRPQDVYTAMEWQLHWYHQHIRHDVKSFSLMCAMLEVINRCAQNVEGDFNQFELSEESKGLFTVLSNAIFKLDQESAQSKNIYGHFLLFLAKLSIELGVFPDVKECILSARSLAIGQSVVFLEDQGGFAFNDDETSFSDDRQLWAFLHKCAFNNYLKIEIPSDDFKFLALRYFDYLCHQFQIDKKSMKSIQMIF